MIQLQTHKYGPQVVLLESPALQGWLADLCSPITQQPRINHLVKNLYTQLLQTCLTQELPHEKFVVPTRMTAKHPKVMLTGTRLNRESRAITINLARAGTYPSHLCYELLHEYLRPENIRQDHIFAARQTNEQHKVTGTSFGAAKIGGGQDDAYVFLPDPMGATGSTIIEAVSHYKEQVPGLAQRYLALHLIVTPEYLSRTLSAHPDIKIYALRLDRGLSPDAVLNSTLGEHWNLEKGLDDSDYIVPGGGGFGELLNNSFV